MEPLTALALLAALLLLLLAAGVWVAVALFLVAAVGLWLADAGAIGAIMATTTWGASSAWTLAALPLFVWMGEILFRTRLAEDLFRGLSPWLGRLPGGLLHANILGCGVFAAVSGSSAATCATIGRMTLPELERRGYDRRLAIGTLAGSATLGLLIPPSLILIVYGVAAQVSIARLFVAGVLPGLLLIALFMAFTLLWSLRHPPAAAEARVPWAARIKALARLLPVLALIAFVIGAIYGGLATATEAAALGVVGALLLAAFGRALNRGTFTQSLMAATRTSCMIAFILAGAALLTVAMGFTGIPRALVEGVTTMGLSPIWLLVLLTLLFLLLGCFLDGISLVVLTTSVLLPVVVEAGIDPLWFGIYLVLVVEMAQITPPIGFNLFVIQGLTGQDILSIARAALPFFVLMLLAIVVIVVFPGIVTWLPGRMGGVASV
ncbi:MAG TPA: TRAP transporter large permease subunit [Xanthomonadaceae bacterium]|nr:TRAP transporter large permease subunit [Xanthomonadaceae bacterium]